MVEIAEQFEITYHTVSAIIKAHIPTEERKRLRKAYLSKAKMGGSNPMFGRRYAAERILRRGYAAVWNGTGYTFEHRKIAAESLGLKDLPPHLEVHHLDGDKLNNSPDNIAIVTKAGHRHLHKQILGRLYVWEKEKFGTSLSMEIRATLHKD